MNNVISVVIPCYNAAIFIVDCLSSIINQTYKNIEIIIIDDASTDNTITVVSEYIKKINSTIPIKIFSLQINYGPAKARNIGVAKSSGQYIAFMDADDISVLNRLELQLNLIISEDSDLCVSPLKNFGNKKKHISYIGKNQAELMKISLLKCPFPQPSVLGKRSVFIENKYNEDIRAEDYDLWATLLFKYKFSVLDKPIILGRNHCNSLSTSHLDIITHQTHSIRIKAITNYGIKLTDQQCLILYSAFNGKLKNTNQLISFEKIIYQLLLNGTNNRFIKNTFSDQLYWVLRKNIHLRWRLFYSRLHFHRKFFFFGINKELKLLASIILNRRT
ncbi:hypothetical protein TUM12151_34000 [Morganella morganii]|uniref:glycosyltransferase family 2 protein n=2 Tax=Enterobacterales TaxID=91347 RepID=UPI001C81F0C8|nr:glycosyltransferase family A protein [Morganella morganii]GIZ36414.1 hypothetical protein TUM12151_34000 [Morganella morganii]